MSRLFFYQNSAKTRLDSRIPHTLQTIKYTRQKQFVTTIGNNHIPVALTAMLVYATSYYNRENQDTTRNVIARAADCSKTSIDRLT
ncbi:MAG: hypothetical protein FWE34_08150 [Defluviitaleaceae bacterium]|nr:hypothetical protein [Defluviitaleaceae bacterium]